MVDKRLHVNDHVCFQSSHEFSQVIVNRFGVQCADVVQVDMSQDDRGADKVQPIDE